MNDRSKLEQWIRETEEDGSANLATIMRKKAEECDWDFNKTVMALINATLGEKKEEEGILAELEDEKGRLGKEFNRRKIEKDDRRIEEIMQNKTKDFDR